MDLHASAVLTVRQRQRVCDLVATGTTITAAALVGAPAAAIQSLRDHSSRPRRSPGRTPDAVEQAILRARAELGVRPHVIGWALGLAASTVAPGMNT